MTKKEGNLESFHPSWRTSSKEVFQKNCAEANHLHKYSEFLHTYNLLHRGKRTDLWDCRVSPCQVFTTWSVTKYSTLCSSWLVVTRCHSFFTHQLHPLPTVGIDKSITICSKLQVHKNTCVSVTFSEITGRVGDDVGYHSREIAHNKVLGSIIFYPWSCPQPHCWPTCHSHPMS